MKHTLLVWEDIPETRRIFLIPNDKIDSKMRDALRKSNGKFINSDTEVELLMIQAAVAKNGEEALEGFDEWVGFLIPFEKKFGDPIEEVEIESFYFTGFIL